MCRKPGLSGLVFGNAVLCNRNKYRAAKLAVRMTAIRDAPAAWALGHPGHDIPALVLPERLFTAGSDVSSYPFCRDGDLGRTAPRRQGNVYPVGVDGEAYP